MTIFALVAQWIEQEPSNLLVVGSIPTEGAFGFSDLLSRILTLAPWVWCTLRIGP